MSQLQVTGEAKIRAIQGPVVANSGVITALDGLPSQYVRGDGTLADIPSVTGGGSSVSYYLNGSVNQGTFGGSTYYQMSKDAITGVGTNFSTSSNGLLAQFITDANDPDVSSIPSGNWNIEFYMGVSASSGSLASFYVEIYKYDGSTFTLIATSVGTPEYLTNTTTVDAYFTSVAMPLTAIATTDRLAVRVYANVASKTVTMYTEDNRLCQIVTTFSKGLLSMNSLTDQEQYLTVGTSGTDFNIVSSGDTHTFNIPSASSSNRGLITTGSQTIAGAKTFSSTATFNTGGVFNNWGISLYDGAGSTALSSSTLTGIYASKSGSITDIVISHNAPYDSILRFSNDVANFTYTFPDLSGTLALLEGTQTFSGLKTFGDSIQAGYGISLYNGIGTGALVSSTYTGFYAAKSGTYTNITFAHDGDPFFSRLKLLNNATYDYTFPAASGTIALLEGAQTFTGAKTFSASVVNDDGLKIKFGSASNLTANYLTLSAYGLTTPNRTVLRLGTTASTLSELIFSQTSSYQYTFPDTSGTLALTSNLSSYVPYTGATGTVNLGNNVIYSANAIIEGTGSFNGALSIKQYATPLTTGSGYTSLFAGTSSLGMTFGTSNAAFFDGSTITANRTYTLPNASGTIALTSNLSDYLPLTGGTLTGKLTVNTSGIDNQIAAIGTAPSLRLANAVTGATINGFIAMAGATNDYITGAVAGDMCIGNQNSGKIIYGFGSGTATALMTITTTGLGIGTTPSAWDTNWDPVQMGSYGATVAGRTNDNSFFITKNVYFNGSDWVGVTTGWAQQMFFDNSGNTIWRNVNATANTATGFYETMRITSGGKVCIGTSSAYSDSALSIQFNGSAFNALVTRPINAYDAAAIAFQNIGGSNVGYISTGASSTNYATSSDYRLKEDLQEINGLEKVSAIKVYDFKWKISDERMDGVIAHELAEILPYAVSGEKDGKQMQGVDYSKIVPVLVKAIQEQQAQIEELKALINK